MNIKERIKEYLDLKEISKYQFYKDMGFSNGFLDKEGSIGSDKCEKIIYQYSDLNIEWLLTGKGPMLKSKSEKKHEDIEPIVESQADNDSILYKMYKEEREENKALLKEIGCLEEKIRQLEADHLNDQSQDAEIVSTKKLRKNNLAATSASAQSKK